MTVTPGDHSVVVTPGDHSVAVFPGGSAEDELFDLVIAVATGGLDTVSKIAKRLSLIVG